MRLLNQNVRVVPYLIGLLVIFSSCKKDLPPPSGQAAGRADQLLKDSVYYYYNLYSLWSDASIPEYSAINTFTNAYDSPLSVLNALKGMTPFYAGYNGSIDRFSYLKNISEEESQSSYPLGMNHGFGLFISIGAVSNDVAYPVVYFVEGGSSAAQAGIRRSDVILEINGYKDLSIPVFCGAENCKVINEQTQQSVINKLLVAMSQRSMQIKVRHIDNSESMFTIASESYTINPIIKDTVFSYPAKEIGYLVLSSFEDVAEGQLNRQRLDQVFAGFEQHQINDLIVDLRYNTGGYVNAVEYIANRVIDVAADGALMYTYGLNAYMSQQPDMINESFDDVYFQRNNNLNLNTVYFLVTDITASASELLINVLRPYLNVIIIAEHAGTYGKPVGFFKQEIMGKVALWAASFKLINAHGETDYWNGIGADHKNVMDDIFRDFGDVEESMLSAALNHAVGKERSAGLVTRSNNTRLTVKSRINNVNMVPQKNMFN